jgi:hypothetical protein
MSESTANGVAQGPAPRTPDFFFNQMMERHIVRTNEVRTLLQLSGASGLNPPNRDLDVECGYKTDPTVDDYKLLYDRGDVAATVVNIWPDECFAAYPDLYETEDPDITPFEEAWAELAEQTLPWHYLHRVDRLSGVANFGALFLGLDDGLSFDRPGSGFNLTGETRANARQSKLLYIRAFDQTAVKVDEWETDRRNPRFGMPRFYTIDFADPLARHGVSVAGASNGLPTVREKVHWTRVVHVADNCQSSEAFGTPRCQQVYNRLMDIRKVAGSSAEMFYKGGFPGYQFKTYPEMISEGIVNKTLVRQEVEAYQQGLQRFLSAVGGEWGSLAPQVADPSPNLIQQLTLLCATIRVPLRIFLGTEAGHLASTQDAGTWKERLRGRQKNYLEPRLVRPFVNRLMDLGCLPRVKKFIVEWRDLKTLGDKDQADVALKKTQAFMQYVSGKVFTVLGPRLFLTAVIGLSDAQAAAVIKDLGGEQAVMKKLEDMETKAIEAKARAVTQGGGRVGNPNRGGRNGRPARQPS